MAAAAVVPFFGMQIHAMQQQCTCFTIHNHTQRQDFIMDGRSFWRGATLQRANCKLQKSESERGRKKTPTILRTLQVIRKPFIFLD
jgi:hypothetical protein